MADIWSSIYCLPARCPTPFRHFFLQMHRLEHMHICCEKSKKESLLDQSTDRKMFNEKIDLKTSRKHGNMLKRKEENKLNLEKSICKERRRQRHRKGEISRKLNKRRTTHLTKTKKLNLFHGEDTVQQRWTRLNLESFSRACERHGILDRGKAHLASTQTLLEERTLTRVTDKTS